MRKHPIYREEGVWKTVTAIAVEMRVEPEDNLIWSIGNAIAQKWRDQYKEEPRKDLHPKKKGGGSHHIADYPPSWHETIRGAIAAANFEAARQGEFSF